MQRIAKTQVVWDMPLTTRVRLLVMLCIVILSNTAESRLP